MLAMYISVHFSGDTLLWLSWKARLTYFQLIDDLGITGGDQKKVGYYAGK